MSSPLAAIGPPGPIDPLGGHPDRPETAAARRVARTPEEPLRDRPAAPEEPAESTSKLPDFPGRELSIRHEADLNQVVVQVLDSETKEVVRQIPPEEVLSVLRQLQKTGVLLDKKG